MVTLEAGDDLLFGWVVSIGTVGKVFDGVCEGGGAFDSLVPAETWGMISLVGRFLLHVIQAYRRWVSSCGQSLPGKLYDPTSRSSFGQQRVGRRKRRSYLVSSSLDTDKRTRYTVLVEISKGNLISDFHIAMPLGELDLVSFGIPWDVWILVCLVHLLKYEIICSVVFADDGHGAAFLVVAHIDLTSWKTRG